MVYRPKFWVLNTKEKIKANVAEIKMQRYMCGVTK